MMWPIEAQNDSRQLSVCQVVVSILQHKVRKGVRALHRSPSDAAYHHTTLWCTPSLGIKTLQAQGCMQRNTIALNSDRIVLQWLELIFDVLHQLCSRYAKTDAASLAYLRRELLRPHYTVAQVGVATAVAASAVGGLFHTFCCQACQQRYSIGLEAEKSSAGLSSSLANSAQLFLRSQSIVVMGGCCFRGM